MGNLDYQLGDLETNDVYIGIYLTSGNKARRKKTTSDLLNIIRNDINRINAINSIPMDWGLTYFKVLYGVFNEKDVIEIVKTLENLGLEFELMKKEMDNFKRLIRSDGVDFSNEEGISWRILQSHGGGDTILTKVYEPYEIVEFYKNNDGKNSSFYFDISR
jgi:hypothetical protein